MKQFLNVLKFELGNYFKNKSFVTTTIVLALLLAGAVIIPSFFMGGGQKADEEEDTKQVLALLDEQGILGEAEAFEALLPQYDWVNCEDEKSLKMAVENQKAEAGFIITGETLSLIHI